MKPSVHGGGANASMSNQPWVPGSQAGLDANGRLLMRRPLGAKVEQRSGRPPSRPARLSSSGRLCLTAELRGTEQPNLWAWVVGGALWLSSLEGADCTPVRLRHPACRIAAIEAVLTGRPIRQLLRDAGIRTANERAETVLVLVESVYQEPESLLLRVVRAEVIPAWH